MEQATSTANKELIQHMYTINIEHSKLQFRGKVHTTLWLRVCNSFLPVAAHIGLDGQLHSRPSHVHLQCSATPLSLVRPQVVGGRGEHHFVIWVSPGVHWEAEVMGEGKVRPVPRWTRGRGGRGV